MGWRWTREAEPRDGYCRDGDRRDQASYVLGAEVSCGGGHRRQAGALLDSNTDDEDAELLAERLVDPAFRDVDDAEDDLVEDAEDEETT
jgi:hypothetical protein